RRQARRGGWDRRWPDRVRLLSTETGRRHMSKHTRGLPRREFVMVVGAAAAALPAARYAKILGANDRVRVGIVGFSDRFRQAHLPAYGQLGKELNFEIVAV